MLRRLKIIGFPRTRGVFLTWGGSYRGHLAAKNVSLGRRRRSSLLGRCLSSPAFLPEKALSRLGARGRAELRIGGKQTPCGNINACGPRIVWTSHLSVIQGV